MSQHLAEEHPGLETAAHGVCEALQGFGERLDRYDDVDHEQHRVFLARGERLGMHLRAALVLTGESLHASALAVIRTAFEHTLTDRLLHEGGRYQLTSASLAEETWEAIQAEYEAQETHRSRTWAAAPTRARTGRVTFTFRGIADRNADPATTTDFLHPLYFEIDRYSPTVGRPSAQEHLDDGLMKLEHRQARAAKNRDRWRNWVSWDALRRNLELNEMYTGRELLAVDVHYSFLSGFVHGAQEAYNAVFGVAGSILGNAEWTFAEELVHLYVAAIGAAELRLLCGMEHRPPPVRIVGREDVEAVCDDADVAAAHLWFPGGTPHLFDVVTEWNRRNWRPYRDGDASFPLEPKPQLAPAEVPYYLNPLERLRDMHRSSKEMTTGIAYQSPWRNPGRW